ncbi:hypothetical protein HOP50_15g74680 [Chloropicon primus]|uniref:Enhancer of polycomb-like protein n=1 Tax=Chloropicon primus TaxID=1764295 RepID=A0A5B8MZ21_9CHLO|nr:hypothetical protein A3770_15p74430 [Chloropicon primus]UPR04134.1 hypothetical protein HOP50_15g74680 [Chloropicon primus]|mmetsp:Transcript_10075/g.28555  ORF Transcript_10075/g.28555 Transcript_10075/m.28555 type:complete len:471 (+) Transcript_10075:439-1851(+)|eukprot:QDZ24925.1 hypothetical protein A3770_15p74430 [Chloropicon primus]
MTTRTSFRPRQVDINRLLPLVRDLRDLDTGDSFASRGVTHGHEALDAENEKILTVKQTKKAIAEIPIPIVNTVSTYEEDYRPDFNRLGTYIRAPVQAKPGEVIEYDLDDDDEAWLREFNRPRKGEWEESEGQVHLEEDKFELMLNKLEFACAEAAERATTGGNASSSNMNNHTIYLQREIAFDALRTATGAKYSVLSAVYNYWRQKRAKWNKPLLRRLQAPTSASDTNPYNVFRPREKANRPQTRRRRENNLQSFEKMKELRVNMEMAKELLEWAMKRERRKRDFVCCQCDLQKLKIKLHHDPKSMQEAIDSEALSAAKSRSRKYAEQEAKAKEVEHASLANSIPGIFPHKPLLESFRSEEKVRKKKRRDGDPRSKLQPIVVPPLPPPPEVQEVEMLFTKTFDLADLPFASDLNLPADLRKDIFRVRVGRGGRLIMEKKLEESPDGKEEDSSDYFLNSTYKMYPFMPGIS